MICDAVDEQGHPIKLPDNPTHVGKTTSPRSPAPAWDAALRAEHDMAQELG